DADAHYNRGLMFQTLERPDDAIASYVKAIRLRPEFAAAHKAHATGLMKVRSYEPALASYEKAYALSPGLPFLRGERLHAKAYVCDWHGWEEETAGLREMLEDGRNASPPFPVLALPALRRHQLSAARALVLERYPPGNALPFAPKTSKSDKLRIGYFSSDFRNHPVAFSIAQVIEKHDRSRFEIFGFSCSNADDDMRRRLRAAFDQFIDGQGRSDRDVVLLARRLGIDIAVDLNGFTAGGRTGIFAQRAAPLQVCSQGYPGTMGAGFIDYLIADPTVIPEDHRPDYAEKIVYLPDMYHPNDTSRAISDRTFTRAELGLPRDGFVFCCFNNTFKITPEVFDDWMAVLAGVPGSVLWLLQTSALAMANLRREAGQRGIAAERLVFASRMAM